MNKKEEEKLADYKKMYDQEPIPEVFLDEAIAAGMKKAQTEKKKPRTAKKVIWVAVVAIVLFGFSQGIGKILNLVQEDKGLKTAIQNDYYQEIGVSDEKNGLKVMLDGVIADEQGIVLFYTIHSNGKRRTLALDDVDVESMEGESLELSTMSYGGENFSDKAIKSNTGIIEYFFQKPFSSKKFQAHFTVKGEEFDLPFTLNKDIEHKKTYNMDEEIVVEGQQLFVSKIDIYPLRTAIHIEEDPDNTKRMLNYDDLHLEDEQGETWGKIVNGVTGTGGADDEKVIYLQSNYFHEPKALYLTLHKIQAVDKAEGEVVIDTDQGKIIKQPEGDKLKNISIETGGLQFELHTDEPFSYVPFSSGKDAEGNTIVSNSSFIRNEDRESGASEHIVQLGFYTEKQVMDYPSPLSFTLDYYPEWIEGDIKVKVK